MSRGLSALAGALLVAGAVFAGFQFPWSKDKVPVTSVRTPPSVSIEVGIAYSTAKKRWFKWAVQQFNATSAGQNIKINLIPMGSLEGAHAILEGDKNIHVWSPSSPLYGETFQQEWQVKYNIRPFHRVETLALSPMVFVLWEDRYQALYKKHPEQQEISFASFSKALAEPRGWAALADKPEWGLFKFGHTHPNKSNSGMMGLVMMAYHYHQKCRNLSLADILDGGFLTWMKNFEYATSGLSNSTGSMMREMVLKGPSSFDALLVYESVAIDYLKNAEGRWGSLRIVYPQRNMWNDHQYYILNVPWSDSARKKAAESFLEFLLTERVQKQSLVHGFRPGNPTVPIKFPGSPFLLYQKYGLRIDLSTVCELPRAEVVNNLLSSWRRVVGRRY